MRQPIDQVPYDTVLDNTDRLLVVTNDNKLRQITTKNALKDATVIPVRYFFNNLSDTSDRQIFDNGDHIGMYGMKLIRFRVVYQTIAGTDASNYWSARLLWRLGDQQILSVVLNGTDATYNVSDQATNTSLDRTPTNSPLLAIQLLKTGIPSNTGNVTITAYLTRA